ERSVAVRVPDGKVLANPIDLDRLQDDLDAERSENTRNEGEESELQSPPEVESAPADVEEILPEREVFRFDRDEVVQGLANLVARALAQFPIERQIEELIQNQPLGQTFVVLRSCGAGRITRVNRHSRPYSFAAIWGRRWFLTGCNRHSNGTRKFELLWDDERARALRAGVRKSEIGRRARCRLLFDKCLEAAERDVP